MRSTDRFLTTHTGSLPRPADLIRMMFAKEEGVPVDPSALDARIRSAVAEVVSKQVGAGVDLVNDGEMSKPSYATYVKDRLNGFGGQSHPLQYRDLVEFPEMAARVFGDPGRSRRRTPACNGPISVRDPQAARRDADNLKSAVGRQAGFLTAASPGVISLFFHNDHYPSHEAYLFAIAEAMRQEYETIAAAGFVLQVDCPDLAMGRHLAFPDLSTAEFLKIAEANVEALNHALRDIPADRIRLHLCWGNYEGPHHRDIPLRQLLPIALKARPHALSFEGANPRHEHEWRVWEKAKLPRGKTLVPGVISHATNIVEHPELVAERLVRLGKLVGRENLMAGTDCGFAQGPFHRRVHPTIMWAKLEALAAGARLASRELS